MESKKLFWQVAALCAIAAIALHAMTWNSPPLFDDKLQLTQKYIFSEYAVPFTLWQRWLSYGTFAWSYKLFGESWPLLRLENVLLHAGTVLALLAFYARLYAIMRIPSKPAILLAGAGAFVFAVHPITVYAVSYLIQRSIVMAALFSVLALIATLLAMETGRRRWLAAAAVSYVLALSSKEHAVMLPLVAASLVYIANRENGGQGSRRYHLYIFIPFILSVVAVAAKYHAWIAAPFDEASVALLGQLGKQYPAVAQHAYLLSVMNEAYLFFKYLVLWLIPNPAWMSVDMRQSFPTELTAWPEVLGPIMYLAYGVVALYLIRRGAEAAILGFGLLVPWLLFPTEFATVWIQDSFVLYRSYLWMIGLPALLPWVYRRLGVKVTIIIVALLTIISVWASMDRMTTFKSEYALWNDAVRYNEYIANPVALGRERAYNERGSLNIQMGKVDEALADYGKALAVNPQDPSLYANRAALMILLNRDAEAAVDLAKALKLDPRHPHALYNRAAMLARGGKEDLAMAELNAILADFELASADAYSARGTLLLKQQQFEKAITDFTAALHMQPGNASAYMSRGGAKVALGDGPGALSDYEQAIAINPTLIGPRTNRALLLLQMGKYPEALNEADAAVAVDSQAVRPHLVRAQIYVATGRLDDAMAEYDRVLEKNPNEAMTRLNRGEVETALGRIQAARADLDAACKLGLAQGCAKLAALPK